MSLYSYRSRFESRVVSCVVLRTRVLCEWQIGSLTSSSRRVWKFLRNLCLKWSPLVFFLRLPLNENPSKENNKTTASLSHSFCNGHVCEWLRLGFVTPTWLVTGFVAFVELRQSFDQLREARVRVVLEVVFLQSLELASQTALARGAVQYPALGWILWANWKGESVI